MFPSFTRDFFCQTPYECGYCSISAFEFPLEAKPVVKRLSVLRRVHNLKFESTPEAITYAPKYFQFKKKILPATIKNLCLRALRGPIISPLCGELTLDTSRKRSKSVNPGTFLVSPNSKTYCKSFRANLDAVEKVRLKLRQLKKEKKNKVFGML